MNRCTRNFDDTLLSGYLDRALTQADDQRVRVHLETCDECRVAFETLTQLRETTMNTTFAVPADDQWSEAPRGHLSALSRRAGWTILAAWLIGLSGYTAWELIASSEPLFVKLLIVGGWTGISLLLIGVLLDRRSALKSDRYRGVQR